MYYIYQFGMLLSNVKLSLKLFIGTQQEIDYSVP